MNIDRRRKRQLRNIICATWCGLELALVLVAFQLLGNILKTVVPKDVTEGVFSEVILDMTQQTPQQSKQQEDGLVICIDAGHGGKDNGSDYGGRYEKDDNLALAQAVAEYLRQKNITVVMTREDDVFLSLEERCQFANDKQADYFISIHRNDGDGNGVETWVYSGASDETVLLADKIMDKLDTVGIQRNRGVKKGTQKSESGNYYVNIHSDMPSCIVEMGFICDAKDNQLFDANLSGYAAAIGDAILETYEVYGEDTASTENANGALGNVPNIRVPDITTGVLTANGTEVVENTESEAAPVIDLTSLNTTMHDWGLGKEVDEKNRPLDALSAQVDYGVYNALFIGEDSNTIYLTFDEGYEYGYTKSILDTLKDKGVQAVFFVTEPYAKDEPELVQRMIDEGHVVGNHSVTHPASGIPSLTVEKQQEEVIGNHEYIKENFGYEMTLFRYPAGKFSEKSLAVVNNCGYKSVFWSFAYMDYDVNNQPDQGESLKKMTDKLHPGAIYLLHAESKTNAEVLGRFIDAAIEAGYSFGVIS